MNNSLAKFEFYQEKKDIKKDLWKVPKCFSRRKEEKQQYGSKRYKNLPEFEKQRLVKYRKNYLKLQKSASQQWSNIKTGWHLTLH